MENTIAYYMQPGTMCDIYRIQELSYVIHIDMNQMKMSHSHFTLKLLIISLAPQSCSVVNNFSLDFILLCICCAD